MTEKQFDQLRKDLEQIMQKLDNLQKAYEKETGRRYINPMQLTPIKHER